MGNDREERKESPEGKTLLADPPGTPGSSAAPDPSSERPDLSRRSADLADRQTHGRIPARGAGVTLRPGGDCRLAFNVTQQRGRVGLETVFLFPAGPRCWRRRLSTVWRLLWHRRIAGVSWLRSEEARSLCDRIEEMADLARPTGQENRILA
jgi:hypothetical protein